MIIVASIYTRSGYRGRGSSCTLFSINIDPIHIGRTINSAISRDVCAYLSARLPSSLIAMRGILNGVEMEIKLYARKGRMGRETAREEEVSRAKRIDYKSDKSCRKLQSSRARVRIIFKSYLIIARQILVYNPRKMNYRRFLFSRERSRRINITRTDISPAIFRLKTSGGCAH